ncbi:transcription-repair coupling factor [Microbacter margulisiae]|uniref:Transcription-repair-coupling factor n=1 Tax=Microbacter margulisiae TaxID=1350067 RepID=A0A7W5DRP5_9PORP|nr:transcription-repair coupling factor [Microbacter margulisiae]MBB3187874.1 transcription-repair coupling factor (superfamily II helicase) [Microbacter margulisiae]
MELSELLSFYSSHPQIVAVEKWIGSTEQHLHINGLLGSSRALMCAALFSNLHNTWLVILDDAEEAGYFYHDLTQLLDKESVYFFPSSYKRSVTQEKTDAANEILRTEVLQTVTRREPVILVTYPDALLEKVLDSTGLNDCTLTLHVGEQVDTDFVIDLLLDYGFIRVDFVYEPGQFSVRGSILDVFSFSSELPYRIDFFGKEVETIRTFDIETQLSKTPQARVSIVSDLKQQKHENKISFFELLAPETLCLFSDYRYARQRINSLYDEVLIKTNETKKPVPDLSSLFMSGAEMDDKIAPFRTIEIGNQISMSVTAKIEFNTSLQPPFHKNFDLVSQHFLHKQEEGYRIFVCSDSKKQHDRLAAIFHDRGDHIVFTNVLKTLHEGFDDHDMSVCVYTDHQLFDRFHRYSLRSDNARTGKMMMTLKELNQLNIGDYVVHVDHGIGRFGGLMTTNVDGKRQEVIKLLYKDDDMIFVSIHSLHRISKYKGKDGEAPHVNKLGSGAWERLKERTKKKVKDIARELIQLYARRRAEQGFRFTPDSYLQQELEASFIYEDTPDQMKATADVKQDMESDLPMDRLVCGDVGFGKTEVAIRAAFKAATDGKQIAVLVPTTVLAAQHYRTFSERLKDFPCVVDYMSRARSAAAMKELLQRLKEGKIDIVIGTHKLIGKNVHFKDLGLLIIDEEQKFGVSVKERLRQMKVNVDTLTLTATPIPRTLQFSLMGARDLSIINTPPPNRYPIQTEWHSFDEVIIRDAIRFEMERNGQVFFVHNRIHSIYEMEALIQRLIPGVRIAVGHGQMSPDKLEEVILDFIDYEYDVLIATAIIESGIDMPNVNTIIINQAQQFGLSDLHQLRGRVGRSNRKAFCYLFTPPENLLTPEARRRLQAIENFADLGSGFNIAMQDLDIRGAGNMLGAEQSGFIAELGYETYQKILNEAVQELKDEEFSDLYREIAEQQESQVDYVIDCQIESDFEMMFPTDYIESVSERMNLYRQLDNINNENELASFERELIDRFGPIPEQGKELIQVVRLRWLAKSFGFEKMILKNEKWIAYLVSNPQSPYYQSEIFGKLLTYLSHHPHRCQLREVKGKRSVVISSIRSISESYAILQTIKG